MTSSTVKVVTSHDAVVSARPIAIRTRETRNWVALSPRPLLVQYRRIPTPIATPDAPTENMIALGHPSGAVWTAVQRSAKAPIREGARPVTASARDERHART